LNEKSYRCKDAKGKSKRGKKETQEEGNAGRRKRKGAKTQRVRKEKNGIRRRRIGKEMSKEGESRDQRYQHLSTQGPSRAHKLLE